jgi:hypothetical protein
VEGWLLDKFDMLTHQVDNITKASKSVEFKDHSPDGAPGAYVLKKSWEIITMEIFLPEIYFSWQISFCVIKN